MKVFKVSTSLTNNCGHSVAPRCNSKTGSTAQSQASTDREPVLPDTIVNSFFLWIGQLKEKKNPEQFLPLISMILSQKNN
jgi:hypothetical protein